MPNWECHRGCSAGGNGDSPSHAAATRWRAPQSAHTRRRPRQHAPPGTGLAASGDDSGWTQTQIGLSFGLSSELELGRGRAQVWVATRTRRACGAICTPQPHPAATQASNSARPTGGARPYRAGSPPPPQAMHAASPHAVPVHEAVCSRHLLGSASGGRRHRRRGDVAKRDLYEEIGRAGVVWKDEAAVMWQRSTRATAVAPTVHELAAVQDEQLSVISCNVPRLVQAGGDGDAAANSARSAATTRRELAASSPDVGSSSMRQWASDELNADAHPPTPPLSRCEPIPHCSPLHASRRSR